jgi:hypothetical protein
MTRNIVSASRNGGDRLEKLRLLEWCLSRKPHVDYLLLGVPRELGSFTCSSSHELGNGQVGFSGPRVNVGEHCDSVPRLSACREGGVPSSPRAMGRCAARSLRASARVGVLDS